MLEARQVQREIDDLCADPTRMGRDDGLDHVTRLSRELVEMRGKIARLDQDLANVARELRRQLDGQLLPTADQLRRHGALATAG